MHVRLVPFTEQVPQLTDRVALAEHLGLSLHPEWPNPNFARVLVIFQAWFTERPELATWVWFIVVLIRDLARKTRSSSLRSLPTAALAAVVAMLAAGMFEYNFGDSEFLMLLLVLITLPFAGDRDGGLPR